MRWRGQLIGAVTMAALATNVAAAIATPRGADRAAAVRDVEQHLRNVKLPSGAHPASGSPAPAPFPPFYDKPPGTAAGGPAWRGGDWIVPQADPKAVLAEIAADPPVGATVQRLGPNNVTLPGGPRTIEYSAVFSWTPTAILISRFVLVSAIARPDGTTAIELAGQEYWSLPFSPLPYAVLGTSGTLGLSIGATGRHRLSIVVRDASGHVLATATRTVHDRGTLVHLHLSAAVAASMRRRVDRAIHITTREGPHHAGVSADYDVLH
jgi:hypothetical protein